MENGKYLTLKLQLYPNSTLRHLMDRSIEISGYVYNAFVYVGRYYRLHYDSFPSKNDLRRLCTKFWKNCPWMHDVANNCFFECANNAIRSLKYCYKNNQNGKGKMLPNYRKREYFSGFGHISCSNFSLINDWRNGKLRRYLNISKIGKIRARNNQEEPPGLPKTCHIKREQIGNHNEYFATISYLVDKEYSKDEIYYDNYSGKPEGVDVGIANIATLSNGLKYPNKKYEHIVQNDLSKLHRQLSSCVPYTDKYHRIQGKLSHLYNKISNRRHNYTNIVAKDIVYKNGQLFVENLSVEELKKTAYSHSMRQLYNDSNIGYLLKRMSILSIDACRPLQYVEYAYSSQACSKCNNIVPKKLEERTHVCPNCNLRIDRDQNAAINIKNWGLACNPAYAKNGFNRTWLEFRSYTIDEFISNRIGQQSFHFGKITLTAHGSNAHLRNKTIVNVVDNYQYTDIYCNSETLDKCLKNV